MTRRERAGHNVEVEAAIRAAGSVGALERLAGISQAPGERESFWMAFRTLPTFQGLDAGVAELKRRIRARAGAKVPT